MWALLSSALPVRLTVLGCFAYSAHRLLHSLAGLVQLAFDAILRPADRCDGANQMHVDYENMEKIPMTPGGYAALESELKQLKSVERPAIIKAIAEAREHGDLSENAEYHSAREKQSFIEGRIKELEGILGLADVIDPARLSGAIKFGATVTLVDEDTDEEKTWQIVGEHEANVENGLLNIKSPIARALIGKDEGDSVEVRTPGGEKSYEVLKIAYS